MSEKKKNSIAFLLVTLGVLFLCLGVFRGEATVIWRKAVNICLECIGLG